MAITFNIFSGIILTTVLAIPTAYAAPQTCNTEETIKQIKQKLDTIEYYQVKITSTVNKQKPAEMTLYSKRPDLLKAVIQVSDTDKLTIVFDKKYQWIEEGNTVYQVNLNKINRSTERPFDTPYSLAGGLLSGEDYIGTVKTILNIYNLTASCNNNTITLTGNLDIPRFTEYTKARDIKAPIEPFVKQFANTLKKATLKINKSNYLINSYDLVGTDKFNVKFSDYKFDPLTDDQLTFKIPEGVKPVDITPGIEQSEPVPATDNDSQ